MPWFVHAAWKQLFPSGRLISFFAVVSVTGISLGVAVLLIVQSVMNGFVSEIRSNLAQSSGDVRVFSGGILHEWEKLREDLLARADVEAAAPFAQGVVMLQYTDRPLFPYIWGMDLRHGSSVFPVEKFLGTRTLDDLDDRSVFVSSGVARQLGVGRGSRIEVYTPLLLDRLKQDEVILPLELDVAGVFETGWSEVDANTIMVTLRTMQELYGLDDGVHGIALRLDHPDDAPAVAARLNGELPEGLVARTWMEMNDDFLFILRLEKTVMFFIMIFIILVASFSIAVSLMLAVIRKTREIGLLAAMGATRSGIAACFCLQGGLLGVVGTGLGVGLALLVLQFRGWIIETFGSVTGRSEAIIKYYGFADLPVRYVVSDFVIVILFSLAVSTLAGLIPAIRAARLDPSEALRHE